MFMNSIEWISTLVDDLCLVIMMLMSAYIIFMIAFQFQMLSVECLSVMMHARALTVCYV
jgi:hypothetical protein